MGDPFELLVILFLFLVAVGFPIDWIVPMAVRDELERNQGRSPSDGPRQGTG